MRESLWVGDYNVPVVSGRLRLALMARTLVILDLLLPGLGEAGARAA
jgi:hypothetical protein